MSARGLIVVGALLPGLALAWESECANEPRRERQGLDYEHNICTTDMLPQCAEGYEAARGAQLGEHSLITRTAMGYAGMFLSTVDSLDTLSYFVDLAPPPNRGDPAPIQTVEPASPGSMRLLASADGGLRRRISIPELAHAPDYSYSLSDYLMGNEHCPSTSRLAYSSEAMVACHTFRTHTSVVNSSHFVPQSRSIYLRYHRLALQVMQRCKEMNDARELSGRDGFDTAHRTRFKALVQACEREALSLQAFASHFLEDAWSTGHMWQRWGTARFPELGRYAVHHMVGVYSGTVHGLRGPVYALNQSLGNRAEIHDQLCRPGSQPVYEGKGNTIDTFRLEHTRDAPPVEWTYPRSRVPTGTDLTRHPGAGDLYYLQCTATEDDEQLSHVNVALDDTQSPLAAHNRRMMTCVTYGFREVLDASPKTLGFVGDLVTGLDPDIPFGPQPDGRNTGSLSQLCWEQRVTNQSMWEGARLGNLELSLFSPNVAANTAAEFLPSALGVFAPDPTQAQLTVERSRPAAMTVIRASAAAIGGWMAYRAAVAPNETDLANLEGPVGNFAGFGRNESYAWEYDDGGVWYLEQPLTAQWVPQTFTPPLDCLKDGECQATDMRTYCDRWAGLDDAGLPTAACAPLETPVLRAFRDAETPRWCNGDSWAHLEAARAACKGMLPQSPECQACVQVIGPKLRNACDPGVEGGLMNPSVPHPRSICDTLKSYSVQPAGGLGVNWLFERDGGETWEQASDRAVLEACLNGPQGTDEATPPLDYLNIPMPPQAANLLASNALTLSRRSVICGRQQDPSWWERWRTTGDYNRTFRFELFSIPDDFFGAPQPVTVLALDLLRGPRCDPAADVLASAMPVDTTGDGVPDKLSVPWTVTNTGVAEVCTRIYARDPKARTGFRFERQ